MAREFLLPISDEIWPSYGKFHKDKQTYILLLRQIYSITLKKKKIFSYALGRTKIYYVKLKLDRIKYRFYRRRLSISYYIA